MKVPVNLSEYFGDDFEMKIADFLAQQEYMSAADDLRSVRFLSRTVAPHVLKLSELFNRMSTDPTPLVVEESPNTRGARPVIPKRAKKTASEKLGLEDDLYWKDASNPKNRRMAYFLAFALPNSYRIASVFAELGRLGFQWNTSGTTAPKIIEFGAGPAAATAGLLFAETTGAFNFSGTPAGEPAPVANKSFALIEQNKAILEMGNQWISFLDPLSSVRPFHRKVDFASTWLPPSAPKFDVTLMSYVLNELETNFSAIVDQAINYAHKHMSDDAIWIIVEPALKKQSRRLLEFRKALIAHPKNPLQVLLPCLGHQVCQAFENENDWCHEDVMWWRPKFLRTLEDQTGLDRKSLPFSYLVLTKSKKTRDELLPALKAAEGAALHRLVSPSHNVGKDLEFFTCGPDLKRRVRTNESRLLEIAADPELELQRGSILVEPEFRGDPESARLHGLKGII